MSGYVQDRQDNSIYSCDIGANCPYSQQERLVGALVKRGFYPLQPRRFQIHHPPQTQADRYILALGLV
jgi:hypothetical protein